ncbi:MAG: DUF4339 domain-containing protein [Mariniblastus sp.]|nr:DUF4339 domain-containing protein [Mariniblastus sp.]
MTDAMIFVMDELMGKEHGPYTLTEIETQIYQKKLKQKHLVRKADYSKWFRAGELLGKVFEVVEQRKRLEAEQAKEAKTQRKRQVKHVQELEKSAREKIENRAPYEISESDNDILVSYLAALRGYREGLTALAEDAHNSELNDEVVQRGKTLVKMTRLAQSALPDEPIQDFDEDQIQRDLMELPGDES